MEYERRSTGEFSSSKRQRVSSIDLNVLVVGHVGSGKSSFIRTLLETLPIRSIKNSQLGYTFGGGGIGSDVNNKVESTESIESGSHRSYATNQDETPPPTHIQDLIMLLPADNKKCVYAAPYRWVVNCSSSERVSLLLIDSQGLPTPTKNSSKDRAAALTAHAKEILQHIMNFLEVRFEITLLEESKVKRNPRGPDHKIHACIYLLDPHICMENNGLTSIDIYALKKICVATNVILCLGKADSISIMDLIILRQKICADVSQNEIPIYSFEGPEDDDNNEDNNDSELADISSSLNCPNVDDNSQIFSQHLSYSNAVLNSSVHSSGPMMSVDDTMPVQKYNLVTPFTILNSEAIRGDYYANFDIREKCNTTVIKQLETPIEKYTYLKTQILASSLCTDNKLREKMLNEKSNIEPLRAISKLTLDDHYDREPSQDENLTYLNNISQFAGRIYPWGVLYCDKPDHCDLLRIKQILFCTHIRELIFLSKVNCYEQWRTAKLLEIRNSLIETTKYPSNAQSFSEENSTERDKFQNGHNPISKPSVVPNFDSNPIIVPTSKSADSVNYYKPELVKNNS